MGALEGITRRPAVAADRELLYRIYASTRTEELASVPWSELEKEQFLRMQFDAQDTHYRTHFTGCDFLILERDGAPIGRLYVDRRPDEICLVDIALLPEHRGAGVGTALIEELLGEAREIGKPIRCHVEHFNRALGLYERFGFRRIGDTGVYYRLEWDPRQDTK